MILLILEFEKMFPFHIETSHIWFAVEIKCLVSILNAKLVWNELSSPSRFLLCRDKQLRLLIVYNKTEDPSEVLYQICDVKWGKLFWTVYTSVLRNLWTPCIIKNYTKLSMTNQVINYQEACFFKIKYILGISLKKYVSATCFCTTLLGFTMALLNWQPFFKEFLNQCCFSNIWIRCI